MFPVPLPLRSLAPPFPPFVLVLPLLQIAAVWVWSVLQPTTRATEGAHGAGRENAGATRKPRKTGRGRISGFRPFFSQSSGCCFLRGFVFYQGSTAHTAAGGTKPDRTDEDEEKPPSQADTPERHPGQNKSNQLTASTKEKKSRPKKREKKKQRGGRKTRRQKPVEAKDKEVPISSPQSRRAVVPVMCWDEATAFLVAEKHENEKSRNAEKRRVAVGIAERD